MRPWLALYRREMTAYLHSPIAYVLWAAFLVISGYFFSSGMGMYTLLSLQSSQGPMMAYELNLQNMLMIPLFKNMSVLLLLICPLLTMRLLSEEQRTGTLELLLAYPVSDTVVVTAKFCAAWTMYALILAPTVVHVLMLAWVGYAYVPIVLMCYLALLLLGGSFLAVGLTASAVSENQIIAAVISFCSLMLLWTLTWGAQMGGKIGQTLAALSYAGHFDKITKGLLNTGDLVYFILFIAFFLFTAVRILEAKRWKA